MVDNFSAGVCRRSDEELVRAHIEGDRSAFAELARRHRPGMRVLARRLTGDPDDAGDVVQEAFLRAMRGARRFRGRSTVESWLQRIVVNLSFDLVRRTADRREVLTANVPDRAIVPDAHAASDLSAAVAAVLASLPDDQVRVAKLVLLQERSIAEVAEELGIPEGTVKSRCARVRERLGRVTGVLPAGRRRLCAPRADGGPPVPGPRRSGRRDGGGSRAPAPVASAPAG
jgi:RNA polymerase sigma-70 factor (ECF subfamily)